MDKEPKIIGEMPNDDIAATITNERRPIAFTDGEQYYRLTVADNPDEPPRYSLKVYDKDFDLSFVAGTGEENLAQLLDDIPSRKILSILDPAETLAAIEARAHELGEANKAQYAMLGALVADITAASTGETFATESWRHEEHHASYCLYKKTADGEFTVASLVGEYFSVEKLGLGDVLASVGSRFPQPGEGKDNGFNRIPPAGFTKILAAEEAIALNASDDLAAACNYLADPSINFSGTLKIFGDANLAPVSKLEHLKGLDLSDCPNLNSLAPLQGMTSLEQINLKGTKFEGVALADVIAGTTPGVMAAATPTPPSLVNRAMEKLFPGRKKPVAKGQGKEKTQGVALGL